MLERFVEIKTAVVIFLNDRNDSQITGYEWDLATELVEALRPLYIFTTEVSTEKHCSVSKVIPITYLLMNCYKTSPNDMTLIGEFKREIYSSVLKRLGSWVEDKEVCAVATLLDPRYKTRGFFSGDDKVDSAKIMLKQGARKYGLLPEPNNDQVQNEVQVPGPSKSVPDVWNAFVQKAEREERNPVPRNQDSLDNELEKYLRDAREDLSTDPFDYWVKTGKNVYPTLFQLVKRYLIVPATSVPSERVFSRAGLVLSKLRSQLGPESVNMLIVLNKNMSEEDL